MPEVSEWTLTKARHSVRRRVDFQPGRDPADLPVCLFAAYDVSPLRRRRVRRTSDCCTVREGSLSAFRFPKRMARSYAAYRRAA